MELSNIVMHLHFKIGFPMCVLSFLNHVLVKCFKTSMHFSNMNLIGTVEHNYTKGCSKLLILVFVSILYHGCGKFD